MDHIDEHPTIVNDIISRRETFFEEFMTFFGPTESQDVKQLMENGAIFIQSTKLQLSIIESNMHAPNITRIHLPKNIPMIGW